ncbi:hypothetical protein HPC62_00060 [Thermoleptolyngbya sichuanensis A183]|uniref:Uncharacterized protein n=1 Tax=Thermoleptolyngbya sichuanensis A183 TaxID=2737172 RepID=A0A6M8BB68_9CYAN|nr:hypothetical protein [Thermoleptolyngbya sichuanensis]QKD80781.1 hypothetical protein HPC62_00060 [Thermoleptolyngbya sichuanensis A183]
MGEKRLPYFHDWERAVARELAEIQFLLSSGVFETTADLCDRLQNTEKAIREQYSGLVDYHADPIAPGPPDDFWQMK